MIRSSWATVSKQLDHFFLLPFASNETAQLRAMAIESYLEICGYTWDDVIQCIIKEDSSKFDA